MKITHVETIQVAAWPQLVWVEVSTDSGLVGLGETYRGADTVASYVHEIAAPYLLGQDPRHVERHSTALLRSFIAMVGYNSSGAEVRGASALDIALWDIV